MITVSNGSISEGKRNYFGYAQGIAVKDLCFLSEISDSRFMIKQYKNWMKDIQNLKGSGTTTLTCFIGREYG